MLNKFLSICLLLISSLSFCQIQNIVEKFDMPATVLETSGLLFLDGKLITHNDSGDVANLYEIDTLSGVITRTISINNASNVDWEDLAHDDTYIYIGDIGNNNGTRTDLTIYRILKTEYVSNTSIAAEIITFSYADQSDFTSRPNNHNFDAEAISIYNDKIVIFTKNWTDNTVNAYIIDKTIGNHSATKVSSFNSNGLITGSAYNNLDDSFMLSGYNTSLEPFVMHVKNNQPINHDFFSGTIERTDLTSTIISQGSQIEGITTIENGKYFVSREQLNTVVNTVPIVLNQKLYRFDNGSFVLHTDTDVLGSAQIFPNPSSNFIQLNNINTNDIATLKIYDVTGKLIELKSAITNNQISIQELPTGLYFLKLRLIDNRVLTKKFFKN